jgi:hypothetical protein
MAVKKEARNLSVAARESRMRELAVLDWAQMPTTVILEKLDLKAWSVLKQYRETKEYQEALEDLRAAWNEQMLRLPQMTTLKKKVEQAMVLGLNALITILSAEKTQNKDKIAAARLAAQMDGRFLGADNGSGEIEHNTDTVAQELLTAIKRQKELVQ